MPLVERRYGALAVIEQASSGSSVDRGLKNLDPNLFLEKQLLPSGKPCWCVCEEIGTDLPPLTVYEFRSPDGEPIPYPSMGIVEEMERRRAMGELGTDEALKIAKKRAAEIQERSALKALEDLVDSIRETERTVNPDLTFRRRHVIPAGPGNAQARRRARRKGLIK
jgi:hypothetical protein